MTCKSCVNIDCQGYAHVGQVCRCNLTRIEFPDGKDCPEFVREPGADEEETNNGQN